MMLTVIDIIINLYICQKHVMILPAIDIKSTQSMTPRKLYIKLYMLSHSNVYNKQKSI